MLKDSLLGRFTLITVLILLCVGILQLYPLKGGIDLAGGIDLIYELDLSRYEGNLDNTQQLAEKVRDALKRRVDPQGVRNLNWRIINNGQRIQIQMPLATEETKAARERFREAEKALADTNLRQAAIGATMLRPAEEREAALDKLAAPGTQRRQLLAKLASHYDAMIAAEQRLDTLPSGDPALGETLAQLTAARNAYNATLRDILATNVDVTRLTEQLELAEEARDRIAAQQVQAIRDAHPEHQAAIQRVIDAYRELSKRRGGGFDDPSDLERLLRGRGVLEFRIAANSSNTDLATITEARNQLKELGPRRTTLPNLRWFEIDTKNGADLVGSGGYVTEIVDDQPYILLATDPQRSLTQEPGRGDWRLTSAYITSDPNTGGIAVGFAMDANGATYFGRLTTENLKQPMAILLDDKVLSAPTIQSAITQGHGQITFGTPSATRTAQSIVREAETLVKMLEAGSLPATVKPEPVSKQIISPSFGADRIEAGFNSGIIALIAVVAFMCLYYSLTGTFASIAMVINLLMTIAIMALFSATWTLPGIAGLVLTLGMAVDANVLINERIREELKRGASLWLAIRQGYDRVFWTIFDANLTTSLTAIVLIIVGSEEVKGFGLTLLIGLSISMFTALFVTRTFMIACVRAGILRHIDSQSLPGYFKEMATGQFLNGRWPFMKVITVSNVNWIGLRWYFWTFSIVITILGMSAFFMRGDDKYDTEFNGGTQVTFELREGLTLPIDEVRSRVTEKLPATLESRAKAAQSPELAQDLNAIANDLKNATNVVEVGQENRKFQVVTPVAEPDKRKLFLDALADAFESEIDSTRELHFANANVSADDVLTLIESNVIRPVERTTLTTLFPEAASLPPEDRDVTFYKGGTAIELSGFSEPVTLRELQARIARMANAPDHSNARQRDRKIIVLESALPQNATAAEVKPEDRIVQRAVVLAADPAIAYSEEHPELWTAVAQSEWKLIHDALTQASTFQGVTSFDPVVADAAKMDALVAIVISLALIVVYVWIRFGGLRYGIGAILALIHDATMAVAATALSGWIYTHIFGGQNNFLLISDFKINLTMIAAYLTIIGYSVNDTIVIFDRIRENRGRSMTPLNAKLINDSINQCFGRTVWTTFTVLIVVLIMYIWGGEGIRGFAFAMLIGVITGAYSTLAIASPMLLTVKERAAKPAPQLPGDTDAPDASASTDLAPTGK